VLPTGNTGQVVYIVIPLVVVNMMDVVSIRDFSAFLTPHVNVEPVSMPRISLLIRKKIPGFLISPKFVPTIEGSVAVR
jgi:hypothetical protein